MKRTLVLSLAFLIFAGIGAAVVGGPEAPEDGAAITGVGGPSSEATTGVGPEGQRYRATVENTQSSCMTGGQSTGVDFGDFQKSGNVTSVDFNGTVGTSDPCHRVSLDVSEESGNVYVLEIVEESKLGENESCQLCTGAVEFSGSFEAGDEYRLKVFHEGEKIFDESTEDYHSGEQEEDEAGSGDEDRGSGFNLLKAISGFFNAFF